MTHHTDPAFRRDLLLARILGAILFLPAAAAGAPTPPSAQLTSPGPQFQVNSATVGGQLSSRVGAWNGGFVVVWESSPQPGDLFSQVRARVFAASGSPLGGDFQVSDVTSSGSYSPGVSVADDGRFLVIWYRDDPGAIMGRLHEATGVPEGDAFPVHDFFDGGFQQTSAAFAADGSFLVASASPGSPETDSSGWSILGRLFDSSGAAVGDDFQINSWTTASQIDPEVAALPTGGFVVVWMGFASGGDDTDGTSVQLRRVGSDGTALANDFQVNSYTTGTIEYPRVAASPEGSFIVTWDSVGSPGPDDQLVAQLARRFDSAGNPNGKDFQVNTWTTGAQFLGDVAALPEGGFVVAWTSGSWNPEDPDGALLMRRYDSIGQAVGGETLVSSFTTGSQVFPSLAADDDGNLVATWTSDGSPDDDDSGSSVQARIFRAEAEVGVALSGDPEGIPGGMVSFSLVASNAGPDPATTATVDLPFPAVLDCSWTSMGTNGATGHDASGSGDLAATLMLPPSAQVSWTIDCTVDGGAATADHLLTTTIAAAQIDTTPSDDLATFELAVTVPLFADGFESGDTAAWSAP